MQNQPKVLVFEFDQFPCFHPAVEKMSRSGACIDLLEVEYIQAVFIDKDGQQKHSDHISANFSIMALQTKATAASAVSNLAVSLLPRFEAAVQKLTPDASFQVNGILDQRNMTVREVFDVTFEKAIGLCAVNILRNKPAAEVCQVAVSGVQLKHNTAVVKLMSVDRDTRQKAKGTGQQPLCGQVRP
jgi:hypothetical protein